MGNVIDPVDKGRSEKEAIKQAVKDQTLSVENMLKGVTLEDLRPIPRKYSKAIHPFDGYPLKYATLDGQRVCLTHIVVYDNQKDVFQDPSGVNQSIVGRDGKERRMTLKSPPNRTVMDYDMGGKNTHVIFDRELTLSDGKVVQWVAFVPSHSVRAQLCFNYDSKNDRVDPSKDYFLFDLDQSARLRRIMDNILKPQRKAERDAKAISGESQETLDQIPDPEGDQ
jgi:hypothetical protein